MASKPWTDAEKVGILFQIIEKAGGIPWDDLKLPEGRTKKAVQVMIDKEKQKIKKAKAAEEGGEGGEGDGAEQSSTPKRKATGDAGGAAKKPKTPRKKKVKAGGDEGEDKDDEEAAGVKAEPEDEEFA